MLTQEQSHAFAPPPRTIPWRVRMQLLFGGAGWQLLWFIMGLVLTNIYGALPSLNDIRINMPQKMFTVTGTVHSAQEIEQPMGDRNDPRYKHLKFYGYQFDYRAADGKTFTSRDVAVGYQPKVGEAVTVRYRKYSPQFADGAFLGREAAMPAPAAGTVTQVTPLDTLSRAWPLFLPLLLVAWLCVGIRHGARQVQLLRQGKLAWAKLASAEKEDTEGQSERPAYRLALTFSGDDGRQHNLTAKLPTATEWRVGDDYPVLYDAANPNHAITLCTEADHPFTINARGELDATPNAGKKVLILPTLVGIATIIYLCLLLFRIFFMY